MSRSKTRSILNAIIIGADFFDYIENRYDLSHTENRIYVI